MNKLQIQYTAMSIPERMAFLQFDFFPKAELSTDQELNSFLSDIISDVSENSYLKKLAIERLMDLVFLKRLKPRQALTILIDIWAQDDLSLNLSRIKSLYYLYEHDTEDIEKIFHQYLDSTEAELMAEALFHLGLIDMQQGLLSKDMASSISFLEKSRSEFLSANQIIENRADAQVFTRILDVTVDILKNVARPLKTALTEIATLLFKIEGFSFNFKQGPFYVGFYRTLVRLVDILEQNPGNWLNYRTELSSLFHQYALIQNEQIKDRLSLSQLSLGFLEKINTNFFEPFFALNFSADQSRISVRLSELPKDSQEASFLENLLALLATDPKKKASVDALKDQLKELFPLVEDLTIDTLSAKYSDENEQMKWFKIYSELAGPSAAGLGHVIIRSCLLLQENRIYYGNYSEDDRNTFISSMLESAGYLTKDQTRKSTTQTGKSAGEVDIFIQDANRYPISIIEALNLTSVTKTYIETHIDKIFTYDSNGLADNYILVYANAPNFGSFYTTYRDFVKAHTFKYPLVSLTEDKSVQYTELKKFTIVHQRNGVNINMHHIVINLCDKK
jgi:hypothetical protein